VKIPAMWGWLVNSVGVVHGGDRPTVVWDVGVACQQWHWPKTEPSFQRRATTLTSHHNPPPTPTQAEAEPQEADQLGPCRRQGF
jgi:hypothetical protein